MKWIIIILSLLLLITPVLAVDSINGYLTDKGEFPTQHWRTAFHEDDALYIQNGGYIYTYNVSPGVNISAYTDRTYESALKVSNSSVHDMKVRDDLLWYVSADALGVLDLTDPLQPVELYESAAISSMTGIFINASGDRIYTCGDNLITWDISDPSAPVVLSTLAISLGPDHCRIAGDGNYLYLVGRYGTTSQTKKVLVIGLANPDVPVVYSDTAFAPATNALQQSAEYFIPPSAITGTSYGWAALAQL